MTSHRRQNRWIRIVALVLLSAWIPVHETWAAEDEASLRELESYQLLQLLKTAPPAPMPPMPVYSEVESSSAAHRSLVSYDLATGEVTVLEVSLESAAESRVEEPRAPRLPWDADQQTLVGPEANKAFEGLGDDGLAGSCTPPGPNLATHTFPWNTTYKLLMRFNVGGTDFFYVCSAASMGSFHLLTAGHCIYNHDPNDDGSTADADWADEVWAWAAQTDYVNPLMGQPNDEDRPYGFAKATHLRSYTGWTGSGNLDHDMGYITLDRRDGDHTGWMGREAGVTTSSLNFNGYPTETPYVPAGEIRQYPGFDSGNVDSYTTYRINLCAFSYGGHSGGPDWRLDGTDRYIQGVNSTSDRVGSAAATRITSSKFSDINALMAADEIDRAPVARPDLAEYFFTAIDDRKDLLSNIVPQGDTFQVEYSVLNAGFAASGTITVDFYLSTNNIISDLDTLVGTVMLGGLNAFTFTNPVATLTANVSPGTYFAGWIMSSAVPEYGGDLTCTNDPCTNVAVIADETLTVLPAVGSCTPDWALLCPWSLDLWANNGGGSTDVVDGYSCNGLDYSGPEYTYVFQPVTTTVVTVRLSGLSADLDLFVLTDTGGGCDPGNCSAQSIAGGTSDEQITFTALAGTTYYIVVDGYSGAVSNYVLRLLCGNPIFFDGFESGDTSAWSGTTP